MSSTVHDPKVLRAIAHPVRNRILGELSASGSLRAADLARLLDIPANQASFHLRQLAKYGLVEEDPDAARDKRDRVWRSVNPEGLDIDVTSLASQPGGKAAADVFMRNTASWTHVVVDHAFADERPPDTHRSTGEHAIRLTKDEAKELSTEIVALLGRWQERTRDAATDHDGRLTYLVHTMLLPYPALTPAAGPEDTGGEG